MINLKNWLSKTGEYNNLMEFIQNKLKRSIVMIQIVKAKKISKSKKNLKNNSRKSRFVVGTTP